MAIFTESKRRYPPHHFHERGFLYLYLTVPSFRKAADSGKYVYVNGKVVLRSPSCLRVEKGILTTIPFSRDELSDYCLRLVFSDKRHISLSWIIEKIYDFLFLLDDPIKEIFMEDRPREELYPYIAEAKKISSLNDVTSENLFVVIGSENDEQASPNDFCMALVRFMSERGVTVEALAEETGLSEKTIQRMRTDADRSPTLESVVAVCVGLHLDPYSSDMLLCLAGYRLTKRKVHKIYRLFLNFAYKNTVAECNDLLLRLKMKPLTDLTSDIY